MKKIIAVFLLTLYTATTFGVTLNFNYCGGHLNHVSVLNFGDKVACSCDPGTMPKGCCKDKTVCCKTDNHKKFTESFSFNEIAFSYHLPVVTAHTNNYGLWPVNKGKTYFTYQVRQDTPFPIYLSVRSLRL